jgi:hypothetical protein
MSDKPKSSLELVMERLRKKDAEAGVEETRLTDQQRDAELRRDLERFESERDAKIKRIWQG